MIAIVARLRIINIDKAMWLCTVWVEDFEEGKTMMLLRGGQHHQQRAPLHSFALFFPPTDLKDEKSDTFKTLRIIPPLYFAL